MKNSPTIPSIIVKITIEYHNWSGLETKCSIIGFIPNAFGRKWLNFSPIYPASSGLSLFSKISLLQKAEKYVQPATQRRAVVNIPEYR